MANPERIKQIKELFQAALECEPQARAAFLAEACAGDEDLRREVESLLIWETQAENFIEKPALKVAAEIFAVEKTSSLIGRKISGYKIEKQLGAGGMGEVYLAYDHRLGRRVALKLLPEHFIQDQQRVRRFVQESRAASALNHPNIVTIYEIGNDEDRHFIAQEFVEGQTLRDRLLRAPMKLSEAIDVAIQIVAALTAAHEAGIVHRDIKPENVMLRPDGYVKVLDFGLAKLLWRYPVGTETNTNSESSSSLISHPSTTPGLVMGTVRYMSPEQLRDLDVDVRSDIFSFGITFYEMISGQRPFAGETTADVIAAILERETKPLAELNSETPELLEKIVSKALKKRREERYQTSHELLTDLRELRQEMDFEERQRSKGQRVSSLSKAAQTTPAKTASAKFKLKRFIITAAVLLLMLTAGAAIWSYVKQRQAHQQIAQIQALVEQQRFFEAYDLAKQAEKYLPDDATLKRLMPTITDPLTVTSEPSGASVSLQRFNSEEREKIGVTPLTDLPVARGEYILRVEK
ncbi:MAG TPA: serine/threonine-protein kinase, partial [Blastocatellia bacterium]|nr:serine/threonine-protein kinase [Blastocatellia bacterium]